MKSRRILRHFTLRGGASNRDSMHGIKPGPTVHSSVKTLRYLAPRSYDPKILKQGQIAKIEFKNQAIIARSTYSMTNHARTRYPFNELARVGSNQQIIHKLNTSTEPINRYCEASNRARVKHGLRTHQCGILIKCLRFHERFKYEINLQAIASGKNIFYENLTDSSHSKSLCKLTTLRAARLSARETR